MISRSKRHRNIVCIDDIPVKLTRITDNQVYEPMYLNAYGRVYYFTEDECIVFMKDESLEKYKIDVIKEGE